MSNTNSYESPFCTRYASEEMQYIFSADKKFTTWRKLWVALARAEMKLGLPVTEAQVKQLEDGAFSAPPFLQTATIYIFCLPLYHRL